MVDSWLRAPLLRPSSSRMTIFQRCHVLRRHGWRARLGGQIARSLSRVKNCELKLQHTLIGYPSQPHVYNKVSHCQATAAGSECIGSRQPGATPLQSLMEAESKHSHLAGSKGGALAMMWPPAAAALLGRRVCSPSRHCDASAPRALTLLLASREAPVQQVYLTQQYCRES